MRKITIALLALVSTTAAALAQSSTVPISALPPAATPLSGSEIVAVVQSGATRRATVSNLFSARALTCSPHEWVSAAGSDGRLTCSQPGFADISGGLSTGQLPAIGARTLLGNPNGSDGAPQALTTLPASVIPPPTLGITRSQIPTTTIGMPYKTFSLAGYSTVGDPGAGCIYTDGDSGGPNAIQDAGGNWFQEIDTGTGVSVGCFGAKMDGVTEDTAAVYAALNTFRAIVIPSGATRLGTISIDNDNHSVTCESTNGTAIIAANATATVFDFHGLTSIKNIAIKNCQFYASNGGVGPQTDGTYISFTNCAQCVIEGVVADKGYRNIIISGAGTNAVSINRVQLSDAVEDNISIAGYSNNPANGSGDIRMFQVQTQGGNTGLRIEQTQGLWITDSDFVFATTAGVLIAPGAGQIVGGIIWTGTHVDVNEGDGVLISPTDSTAIVRGISLNGGGLGSNGYGNHLNSGISVQCPSGGNITGLTLNGMEIYYNNKSGIALGCATMTDVVMTSNKIGGNSIYSGAHNSYAGIDVAAGVSHWIASNNSCSTLAGIAASYQGYCVHVAAGASDNYQITNNDLVDYTVQGILDEALGATRIVQFNTPVTWDGTGVPYPGLNTTLDGVAVRIGGFLQAWEFGNGGNFSTTGIVGAVSTPAGTYTGTTPFYPDMGVAGYASTQTTTKSAVGVFGYGGAQIAGASIFGGNTIAVNCNLSASGCAAGGGLDFAFMASNEADVNVFTKSGGGAPSGSASGYSAVFGGNVQPTGDLTGFRVNSATSTHWKFGFRSENGSADAGMKLGAAAASGPAASQPFQQAALDGASAELLGSAIVNSAGDWVFTAPSGQTMSLNSAGVAAFSGPVSATALAATGAAPTLSGTCAAGTQVGGNTAGKFSATAVCANGTYVLAFATTAPNGWSCDAHDQTTPTAILDQTAYTTTTATLTNRSVAVANADVVVFKCASF